MPVPAFLVVFKVPPVAHPMPSYSSVSFERAGPLSPPTTAPAGTVPKAPSKSLAVDKTELL